MSINRPITNCPLLLEHDVLRLHRDLRLIDNSIADAALGLTHQVLPTALPLLKKLQQGASYQELVVATHRAKLSTAQLRELLGFLQMSGGLIRKRRLMSLPMVLLRLLREALLGIQHAPLAYRFNEAPIAVLIAVIRATRPIILCGSVVSYFIAGAFHANIITASYVLVISLAILVSSMYIHEASHILMLCKYGVPVIIIQQGFRLGIVHPPLPAEREALVALAGPIMGVTTCVTIAWIASIFSSQLLIISLAIAGIHLCGLLPWYGDGKSLWTAYKTNRNSLS